MKGDTLFYRLPRSEKQQLFGTFKRVDDFENQNGFVVTDFEMNEKYVFIQKEIDAHLFYRSDEVICESKAKYLKSAVQFLETIKKQEIDKAIYSRVKQIENRFELNKVFEELCQFYPDAFVYLISSPSFGTWVGATPELLLHLSKGRAKTIALAGTVRNQVEEKWTDKERKEQEYVTDFIEKQLSQFSIHNIEKSERDVLNAGPVKHLRTQFQFDLPQHKIISLLQKLHPTPAVSGLPRNEALDLIQKIEKHNRKFYTGVIGFISQEEVNLFVNLRCAEIQTDRSFLYLGGGFTKDSDVEKEWLETERKAETLLNVMQKN